MARGGYDFVVVREMERKVEERKKEASKSGEDVIIDPPSHHSRHQRWKFGRRTISGECHQSDELEAQCTQGSFTPEGRHDILAEAIGRPEHPGRIRGIGFGAGTRDYFGRSSRRSASINESVLEGLTKKITYDVTQNLMKTFGRTLESLGAHSQQHHTDLRTPNDHHVTRVNTKGCCADDFSGPSGGKTPPDRFGFYVDEHPLHLVAIGRVHRGESILHCAPLPAHLVKVVVEEVVDGGAEVPIPTEEVSLVREALGTFIAWPKDLVVADFIKDIERSEPPKKHARQDDRSSYSDTLKVLFGVAATLFSDPIHVPWDTTSFGCGDDVPLYISYNDLLQIIQDKHWLSLSILQFWTLYLSKLNVGTMDDDLYGYLYPQSIQNMGNKGDEASGYITSRIEHWQLLVVIPAKGEVVWFCSLHRKPDNHIKAVFQNVVTAYKVMGGMHTSRSKQMITWIYPKDELEAQCTQGSFTPEGRHDILAEAIGRPEHPGRIRGIGFGAGIRDYLGRSSRRSASINESVLEGLTKKITYDVTQNFMKTFGRTLESLGAHSQQHHTDLRTPNDHHVTRVNTKGCCADDFSGPSGGKTPPDQFGFYVDEHPLHLVAIGRVHRGESILHCAPLPAHLVKVVVEEVVDGGAEVPIPTEEVSLVREALGTFIAWPKDLVVADFIKDIERSEPPKKHARQDDRSSYSDTLKVLFGVAATLFSDPIHVPWDTTSFGCGDDVPLYISYNDLLEIIQDKHWLSLSILQFWTLYLSKLNVGTMDDDLYGYLYPKSIQNMGNKGDEASGYITSRIEHWQLLVVIPAKGEVVWFCSLHRKPDNHIKAVFQNVVTAYKVMGGMHTSRSNQMITWIYPK
ncbi:hypothetical protein OROMI_018616 [Orobanche minor]